MSSARERLKKKLAGRGSATSGVPKKKNDAADDPNKRPCCRCAAPTKAYHDIAKVYVCRECQRGDPDLETISVSGAKREFGTTEKDLESLRFMTRPNPMNPKGPPMRLFLKKEVRRVMLKKYGGEEKLNKVIETRLAKEKEKPSNSLFTAKSANPSVIKFSSQRGATYGCFSTFSPHPVTLKGKEWPTAEHYFQAQKFAGMPLEELIRKAADPLRAKKMGEDKDIPPRSDWKDKQEEVMYEATLAKFTDHKDIQETLLSTGFADIFYHTRSDSFWGDAGDGNGENKLGKILSLVRGKLRREVEGITKRKRSNSSDRKERSEKNEKRKRRRSDSENEEEEEEEDEDDDSEHESKSRRKGKKKEAPKLAEWDISDIL